jgi:hypothetical protein
MMNQLAKEARDDTGATALLVAVMLAVLLGLGAFFIDAGALYSERRSLQGAADAGALAGVQELPASPGTAAGMSDTFATQNAVGLGVASPEVTSELIGGDTVRCTVRDPGRDLMFAPFLDRFSAAARPSSRSVSAVAVAKVQSPTGYSMGVMPFGIMSAEPSGTAPFGYPFGTTVTLKQPAQQGAAGNFQFLSLTDPPLGHDGANDIYDALANGGTDNAVYMNTNYNTKTGINGTRVTGELRDWIGGDTHSFGEVCQQRPDGYVELLDPGCHRLIVCPIIVDPGPPVAYNWNEINGSKEIRVIGFAYFYVEAIGKNGNDCYVTGRFVRPVDPDDPVIVWGSPTPTGAITYRLTD